MHEDLCDVLWNHKLRTRLGIRVELCKDRRLFAEVLFQCFDPILIAGVIRDELRYLPQVRVIKLLKQPYQSPGVVSCAGAYIGAGDIGSGFHVTGVTERVQFAEKQDCQNVCTRGPQKDRGSDFALFEPLILFHQSYGVVMNCVGDFMAQRSGELVRVLYEVQERIDYVDISAWSCERIRLSFVNDIKLERMVISRLCGTGDRIREWLQLIV